MADAELWLIDLAQSARALAELEHDTPRLTTQDRRRAEAIKDARQRTERLGIYAALRLLLERAGGAEVAREPFVIRVADKPRLASGSIDFSLSHIDGYALIGLDRRGAIGVDLERARALRISQRRREALVAAASGLSRRPLPETPPDARFLQAWSRIEAFAKARGRGLSRTLTALGVRGGTAAAVRELQVIAARIAKADGLVTHDLNVETGLFAAVALARTRCPGLLIMPSTRAALHRLLRPR